MEKFYNVRVSYRGEGTFSFFVRSIGEVQIQKGRDLYIVNADVLQIEGLRQLKPAMVDIQIGGKSDGCFKTYDMDRIRPRVETSSRMNYSGYSNNINTVSSEDLSNIKKAGQAGPIILENEISSDDSSNEVPEETSKEDVKLEDYVLTSTSHKGKALKDLKKRQLSGIKKYANDEDKKNILAYLETLN